MQIAIGLYPGFTALDVAGPYQVFTSVPGVEVVLCAEAKGIVMDDRGQFPVDVKHTFDELSTPDVLLVPGGLKTWKIISAGHPIIDWVRDAHEHTTWTTSVCTGALVLGAAGILTGLPATTHWIAYDDLARYGALPTEQRVVIEGKIATAAGVSAGIDLALTLAGAVWGDDVARAVQLGIEYDPQPPYNAGAPSKASPEIQELVSASFRELLN